MDALSIVFIIVGSAVIVEHGPVVFAPATVLRFYDRLILSTNTRVRVFGVVLVALATGLLLLPLGEGVLSDVLHALGWIAAAETLVILVVPDVFRRFAHATFHYLENSVSDAILRIFSLLSIVAGVALIYVGVYIV